jgi:hypothetical protein
MSSNTMSTTTFPRLPGLTLTQRRQIAKQHGVATIRQARRLADAEAQQRIGDLRAPSQQTLTGPPPRRKAVKQPSVAVAIAAGWPQWLLGAVLLMLLFVGAALLSLAHDPRGNVEATTGWTDTPVLQ